MADGFSFSIEAELPNGWGRAGVLKTPHGEIKTPAFIPVGTKATVKGLTPEQLSGEVGAQAVLGNTYHLYLEPGHELIREAGGIGTFMGWSGPTFTDSGGFQVFSLGEGFGSGIGKFIPTEETEVKEELVPYNKELAQSQGKLALIDEDGVTFTSYRDGSLHRFTPERSIEIQHALGADIIFAFDECTPATADLAYQREALNRTHAWAKRSLLAHKHNIEQARAQALFGVVQGGKDSALRQESAEVIGGMDFDGFGLGGAFSKDGLENSLTEMHAILPKEKPRHLLGIGSDVPDLFIGVEFGVDTFDCVAPTRVARTGSLYTKDGMINLFNTKYRNDFSKPDECECYTCRNFTKAYLAHLFRSREILGAVLASLHNEYFIVQLVAEMRQSILDGTFEGLKHERLARWSR